MFSKLKNIFHNKIDTETSEFDTIQIAISTLMIQTAIHDGVFDDSEKNLTRAWLRTKGNSIEGGTSEVQLNVISKRVLELPSG